MAPDAEQVSTNWSKKAVSLDRINKNYVRTSPYNNLVVLKNIIRRSTFIISIITFIYTLVYSSSFWQLSSI